MLDQTMYKFALKNQSKNFVNFYTEITKKLKQRYNSILPVVKLASPATDGMPTTVETTSTWYAVPGWREVTRTLLPSTKGTTPFATTTSSPVVTSFTS